MFNVEQCISIKAISGPRSQSDDWVNMGADHYCSVSVAVRRCRGGGVCPRCRWSESGMSRSYDDPSRQNVITQPQATVHRRTHSEMTAFHPDHNYPRILNSESQNVPSA